MKVPHSLQIKHKVLELGKLGKTYTEIREVYSIPKSTLSYWFKNADVVRDRTKQLEHLKRAREKGVETIRRNKQNRLAEAVRRAETNMESFSFENTSTVKALLAMLYWAEGTKGDYGALTFANTDPALARFYLDLLRAAYPIDESRLRVRIHLHHYHKRREARKFWSELLKVPESQFGKIYVKKRSTSKKFRRNFQGICFIVYGDSSIRRELLAYGTLLAETFEPS